MTFFAVYLASGQIVRSGGCPSSMVSAQAVNVGESAMAVGQMVLDTQDWVNLGAIEQRPMIPAIPATKALAVDEDWSIGSVPDGSSVFLDDVLAGTVDATGLTLSFLVAGLWRLRIEPPWPFAHSFCEVTVA